MSKVYREIGGGPVPGHSGKVAQIRLEVAPPRVVGPVASGVRMASSDGSLGSEGRTSPPALRMVVSLAMTHPYLGMGV